jgi:outer membrane lipoprotein carrier protein
MSRSRAGWGALLAIVAAAALAAADLSATDVAAGAQRHYDTVKDFSADFTHVYRGGVLNKTVTEHGTVLVKKPGKMRWESESNTLYSDGVKSSLYVPADKQVIVTTIPPEDAATTPALFLAGKGNLTRDFTVSLVAPAQGMPAGTLALKLVPKKAQPDYDWLVLEMEPGTYRLRGLVFTDAQGGTSTFTFTNLKENVGPADKEFEFKAPRGVEVVTDSAQR